MGPQVLYVVCNGAKTRWSKITNYVVAMLGDHRIYFGLSLQEASGTSFIRRLIRAPPDYESVPKTV